VKRSALRTKAASTSRWWTSLHASTPRHRAYQDELAAIVPALIQRAENRCEIGFYACTGIGEHPHHVKRRSQGGSNDLSNLRWVCHRCHAEIHRNVAHAKALGYLACWLLSVGFSALCWLVLLHWAVSA